MARKRSMNTKTAKALRKEANHHPKNPVKYAVIKGNRTTIVLHPECSKANFKRLAKEASHAN